MTREAEVVDIITTDGVGISVWSGKIPDEDSDLVANDGDIPFLDIAYPGKLQGDNWNDVVETAVAHAKRCLGNFDVRSAG